MSDFKVTWTTLPPSRKGPAASGEKAWKARARQVLAKVEPYSRAAERLTNLAVHMKNGVTPAGAVGLAATGMNSLREWLYHDQSPQAGMAMPVPFGVMLEAFQAMGASVTSTQGTGNNSTSTLVLGGTAFQVARNGCMYCEWTPEFASWVREAVTRTLPANLRIGMGHDSVVNTPIALATHETPQGKEIADVTAPLLSGGGRCILLDGKPGVGKTTMAQEIARRLGIGRVVVVDGVALGYAKGDDRGSSWNTADSSPRPHDNSWSTLSAAIIIVDDIDKWSLSLETIEALRAAARLVIFTANNGKHDEVIDGAAVRPGRIDEVFTIEGFRRERAEPFDRLDEATWELVREWPIASLNELAKRIQARGTDPKALRLDDLRERVERRTRSGGNLY